LEAVKQGLHDNDAGGSSERGHYEVVQSKQTIFGTCPNPLISQNIFPFFPTLLLAPTINFDSTQLLPFISLALASLGWGVLATDISHVISSVLEKNIKNNLSALPVGSGRV